MNMVDYDSLYNQYKLKDEDFLKSITVENGYTEEAEQAAKDVLSSDSKEYNELQRIAEEREAFEEKMLQDRVNNPLYEDIHQMATDIHFIKNLIIVSLVIAAIAGIFIGMKISDIVSLL